MWKSVQRESGEWWLLMHKFFVAPEQIGDEEIRVLGTDCNHIVKVLRLKNGQKILLNDGQGTDYYCIIKSMNDLEVICKIEDINRSFTELPVKITLFQGLPKQEKMEWIIQKSVELGITDIYPVAMKRCVQKLDEKNAKKKTERWNRIAESAAKQSGRGFVPVVHEPISFSQCLKQAEDYQDFFVPHEDAKGISETRRFFSEIQKDTKIACMIGPEGGYAQEETEALKQLVNSRIITLGKRILRTETAAMAFLSMVSIMIEEDV